MKKIVIAPDSFKGSASSIQIATYIETGAKRACPQLDCRLLPISDGGEGFCAVLHSVLPGEKIYQPVLGPAGLPLTACWVRLADGRAVIELAQAAGLTSMGSRLDPGRATSYGVGQLIQAALDAGCRDLIIGLGGSACTDGGAGMLQALGLSLRDQAGRELSFGGAELSRLAVIDPSGLDPRLAESHITLACDVTNPLTGPQGSAAVFGPQKGAAPAMVQQLDENLEHFARLTAELLGQDWANQPGAGAAGGVGFGLMAYGQAESRPGIDILLDAAGFEQELAGADLLITGEGRIDGSTLFGKAPLGVANRARSSYPHLPVVAFCGCQGPGAERVLDRGIDEIVVVTPDHMELEQAISQVGALTEKAAEELIRRRLN